MAAGASNGSFGASRGINAQSTPLTSETRLPEGITQDGQRSPFSRVVTPPSKPREDVLRAVWGPSGEPGAPVKCQGRQETAGCFDDASDDVDVSVSPRRLEMLFENCFDSDSVEEGQDAATPRIVNSAAAPSLSVTIPVSWGRPALRAELDETPARPLRTGSGRNLMKYDSVSVCKNAKDSL